MESHERSIGSNGAWLTPNEWRDSLLRRMLALSDIIAVFFGSLSLGFVVGNDVNALFWSITLAPAWVFLAKLLGLYDRDQRSIRHLTVDETPLLATWALLATLGVVFFLRFTASAHLFSASAPLSAADGARLMLVIFAFSIVLRSLSRRLWRSITPAERAVIIGSSHLANTTRAKMNLFPDVHMDIVALLPRLDIEGNGQDGDWWRSIDRIIIATPIDEAGMREMLAFGRRERIKVGIVPPTCTLFGTAVHLNHVADLSIVEYQTWAIAQSTLLLKRTFDIVAGGALLMLFAPFALLIALAIMLDSRGSAVYPQRRAGLRGRAFRMYKFRTMVRDAERQLEELVPFDGLTEPMFKLANDPRITRVGRFLRRWSLDELPQLVNVVAGQMSLVGPRPEQIEIVERYTEEQRVRLQVRPGLTGPMQVYGRGELSFEERLAVERDYIESLSLRRDMHLLRMTIPAVIGGRGAF